MQGPTDEPPKTRPSLLVRLRDPRDAAAWGQFVEVYVPLIYGFLRKRGVQDADAADLTQDVLRAVAGAIRRLDYDARQGTFRGWLFTIVRNRLSNFLARAPRQFVAGGGTDLVNLLHAQPAPAADPEAEWEHECRQQRFAWAARQVRQEVEESSWRAFWRTAVEGRRPPDVAGELGLSVAAVYMAKSRVLARLKRQLQAWDELAEEQPHE
jgi:RNA polymerase sigma-70 factor (ECF subfamily)